MMHAGITLQEFWLMVIHVLQYELDRVQEPRYDGNDDDANDDDNDQEQQWNLSVYHVHALTQALRKCESDCEQQQPCVTWYLHITDWHRTLICSAFDFLQRQRQRLL
jgi:hypothetical protein